MTSSSDNPLLELARAAIYIPDMARGVTGVVEIAEDGWGQGDAPRVLEEIHRAQRTLVEAGWRRDSYHERYTPYSHNVEVAVYRKRFKGDKDPRWIIVTVTTRFGIHSTFEAIEPRKSPW